MPNSFSKSLSVLRVLRQHPCPEIALLSTDNFHRYAFSLLQTFNPKLDFNYIARLEISVSLACEGLPIHHHGVAFAGPDLQELINVVPGLLLLSPQQARVRRRKSNTKSAATPPLTPQSPTAPKPESITEPAPTPLPAAATNTTASSPALSVTVEQKRPAERSSPEAPTAVPAQSADDGFTLVTGGVRQSHPPAPTASVETPNPFAVLDATAATEIHQACASIIAQFEQARACLRSTQREIQQLSLPAVPVPVAESASDRLQRDLLRLRQNQHR